MTAQRYTTKEQLRRGFRWTIATSSSGAPELWDCDEFFPCKLSAIAAAAKLAQEHGDDHGYVGYCVAPGIDDFFVRFRAQDLVEQMGEQMFELVGEAAEDWPDNDMEKIVDELVPLMAQAIAVVLRRARFVVQVKDVEKVNAATA